MELTNELLKIFKNISIDSKYSSRELVKKYKNDKRFEKYLKKSQKSKNKEILKLQEQIIQSNVGSDIDIFLNIINNQIKYIVSKIKEEYGDILTQEKLQKLDNIKLEIINDENYKHDFSAAHDENKLIINMYYFGKENGNDISFNDKILLVLGTLSHEIFHFLIQMLSEKDNIKEKMIYTLKNGEEKTVNGMVGHILNEGFVEKISTNFCEKYDIYYNLSPSYISFVDLCTYLMKKNSEIDVNFLFNNNYEEIFKLFSPEVLDCYKEVERYEYVRNFQIDGEYIDPENIESSRNVLKSSYYNSVKDEGSKKYK